MTLSRDFVAGSVAFAIGLAFYLGAIGLRSGADMFPRYVAGAMMLCSMALIVRSLLRPPAEAPLDWKSVRPVALVIAMTSAYVLGVAGIGFVTSSLIFMPAVCLAFGYRRYPVIALGTIISVAVFYLVFVRIFHAPLPPELVLGLL